MDPAPDLQKNEHQTLQILSNMSKYSKVLFLDDTPGRVSIIAPHPHWPRTVVVVDISTGFTRALTMRPLKSGKVSPGTIFSVYKYVYLYVYLCIHCTLYIHTNGTLQWISFTILDISGTLLFYIILHCSTCYAICYNSEIICTYKTGAYYKVLW